MRTAQVFTIRYRLALACVVGAFAALGLVPWRVVAQEAPGPRFFRGEVTPAPEGSTYSLVEVAAGTQPAVTKVEKLQLRYADAGEIARAANARAESERTQGMRLYADSDRRTNTVVFSGPRGEVDAAVTAAKDVDEIAATRPGATAFKAEPTARVYMPGELKRSPDLLYLVIAQTPDRQVAERNAALIASSGIDVSIEQMRAGMYGMVSARGFRDPVEGEPLRKSVIDLGSRLAEQGRRSSWADAFFTRVAATPPATAPAFTFRAQLYAPTVQLRAPVDGMLATVPAVGAQVKKGDTLFHFTDRDAELKVAVDKSRVELAASKLEGAKTMLARRNTMVSAAERDQFEQQIRQAEIEVEAEKRVLDADQQKLQDLDVRAPFDGTVTAHDLAAGTFIPRGAVLTTLVNTAELYVSIPATADVLATLKVGQSVTFSADRQAESYSAQVTYIDPRVEGALVMVRAAIRQPGPNLRPGLIGTVTIGQDAAATPR